LCNADHKVNELGLTIKNNSVDNYKVERLTECLFTGVYLFFIAGRTSTTLT